MGKYDRRRRIPEKARHAFGGKDRLFHPFDTLVAADLWVSQVEAKIKAALAGSELAALGVAPKVTFRLAAAGWLEAADVRPSTRAWYQTYLHAASEKRAESPLLKHLGEVPTAKLGESALVAYRKKRRDQKAGARTIEVEILIAQRVLRWAKRAGYTIDESVFRVDPPEVRVEKARRYNPELVDRLLEVAAAGPPPNPKKHGRKDPELLDRIARRDVLAITLMSRLGLRAGELRAAQVSWIRWREHRLVVPNSVEYSPKGGEERSIPIEADVLEMLEQWIDGRQRGAIIQRERERPVTTGHYRGIGIDVYKLVTGVAKRAGVDLTAHDLRHHAISRWCELMPAGGYSLRDVQAWAGHASIRTTELYLHQAGGRWRSHAEALDRAAAGRNLGNRRRNQAHLKAL